MGISSYLPFKVVEGILKCDIHLQCRRMCVHKNCAKNDIKDFFK